MKLLTDLDTIVAIEIKKVERTSKGRIARATGIDFNTTPPCGIVRIYLHTGDHRELSLDIRCFYFFACLERHGNMSCISAATLVDGKFLNEDFDLYLQTIGPREKEIGLGTYGDGMNRNRPMYVFPNPLAIQGLDKRFTLIHSSNTLEKIDADICLTDVIIRIDKRGSRRIFYCYSLKEHSDLMRGVNRITFPKVSRKKETSPRGKFTINLKLLDY